MMAKSKETITLYQIAKLAGTSKSTVSRVLTESDNVSADTRQRVLDVIEEHNYRPNIFARGLSNGNTGLVSVISYQINDGFFAQVIKGINSVAISSGHHLLCSFARDADDYVSLWQSFLERRIVDGIVMIAPPSNVFEFDVSNCVPPLSICACSNSIGRESWRRVDTVIVDNRAGFEAILGHLLSLGSMNFVHVSGPEDIYDACERRLTFENFISSNRDFDGSVITAGLNFESGYTSVLRYLETGERVPDAFVCFNDSVAVGAVEALKEFDATLLGHVIVTGCDGDTIAALQKIPTLEIPMQALGETAMRLLLERMATPDLPVRMETLDMKPRFYHN